jgi:hypothetical protein
MANIGFSQGDTLMKTTGIQSMSVRRVLLTVVGIGAAGAIATAPGHAKSGNVFACQFLDKAAAMDIPNMVYDPNLQMMVDPATLRPIYQDNKQLKMAKVTAGCSNCPKYDAN